MDNEFAIISVIIASIAYSQFTQMEHVVQLNLLFFLLYPIEIIRCQTIRFIIVYCSFVLLETKTIKWLTIFS